MVYFGDELKLIFKRIELYLGRKKWVFFFLVSTYVCDGGDFYKQFRR